MSQQGIVNLEQGIVKRPRGLIELAAALNTTPEWLLWEEGPEVVRIKHQGNEIAAVMRDLAPEQLPAALMYLHRLSRRKSRQRAS